MRIERMDHLVITVHDMEVATAFYRDVLGMVVVPQHNNNHTVSLKCGQQLIRLQPTDRPASEIQAAKPTPGSIDLCLVSAEPLDDVLAEFKAKHIEVVNGPITKHGSAGKMTSIYVRDPDQDLIEICFYH